MIKPQVRAFLLFILVICFGVLIFGGHIINREKPPIPDQIQNQQGQVVLTGKEIIDGQNYYYSRGGQHIGSIWGHGSYLAPDWSADYLHRLGLYTAARHLGLDAEKASSFTQKDFEALDPVTQARLNVLVIGEIKANHYDAKSGVLSLTPFQAEAFEYLTTHYTELFTAQ